MISACLCIWSNSVTHPLQQVSICSLRGREFAPCVRFPTRRCIMKETKPPTQCTKIFPSHEQIYTLLYLAMYASEAYPQRPTQQTVVYPNSWRVCIIKLVHVGLRRAFSRLASLIKWRVSLSSRFWSSMILSKHKLAQS